MHGKNCSDGACVSAPLARGGGLMTTERGEEGEMEEQWGEGEGEGWGGEGEGWLGEGEGEE